MKLTEQVTDNLIDGSVKTINNIDHNKVQCQFNVNFTPFLWVYVFTC